MIAERALQVHLLDLAGAVQASYEADLLGSAYRLSYAGPSPGVVSAQGLALANLGPLPEVGDGDLVFVPGTDSRRLDELPAAVPVEWLWEAHGAGATVCSVCTGAFALGIAGLLDGPDSWASAIRGSPPGVAPELIPSGPSSE